MKIFTYINSTIILLVTSFAFLHPQARFSGLGDLPGGIYESFAYGVSGDGKVVVGSVVDDSCTQAVKWVYNSELKTFTTGPLGILSGQLYGEARSASYNGDCIAGTNTNSQGAYSFRWEAGFGYNYFVPIPEGTYVENQAYGISADGNTIVGDIRMDGYPHPFKYASGNFEILEIPSSCSEGHARSVSEDGSVIVGSALAYGTFVTSPYYALSWGPSGLITLDQTNQGAGALGVTANGKIAVGYKRQDTDLEVMTWNTDGSGYRYLLTYPYLLAYAASKDGSVIVGWRSDVEDGNKAYVWDQSHGARSIKDVLINDYNLNVELFGWKLLNATGVSADGSVIVGTGKNPEGNTEGWWAYIPFVSLDGPYSNQNLIAQSKDTLRWNYGGVDINSFNIYLSLDSGKTKELIVENYSASSKEYVWEIPDVMAQYCKLYIVCTNDPSVKAESPIFQIKGYRMYRVAYPSGKWELFDPAIHGWSFGNSSSNMWPKTWWQNFNYNNAAGGIDPFTNDLYPFDETFGLAESQNFIDWPLFVKTFGVANCYWGNPSLGMYNSVATEFWRTHKEKKFEGACYGFAYSTLLAFGAPFELRNAFPEMPDFNDPNAANNYKLSSIPLDDNVRKVINSLFFYQYDNYIHHFYKSQLSAITPRQLLTQLKTMFLSGSLQGLSIIHYEGGGHEVVPYRLSENPVGSHKYQLYVNDCNRPLSKATYIEIDSVANLWIYRWLNYGGGYNWSGIYGLTLDPQINRFFGTPQMQKGTAETDATNLFMASETSYDFYIPQETSVIIRDNQGHRLGTLDTCIINEIPDAVPMKSPSENSVPIGYTVPKGFYKIETNNFKDSVTYFTVFTDSLIYSFIRADADSTQKDDLAFGYKGMNFKNEGTVTKKITFTTVIPWAPYSLERRADLKFLSQPGDSLSFYVKELTDVILTNYGSQSLTYDLNLKSVFSSWGTTYNQRFIHKQISLTPNSSHKIHPSWSNISESDLEIIIDNNNDGSYDSTARFVNQITGIKGNQGSLMPTEYRLEQNYPNPFNSSSTIKYSIPKEGLVTLKIYSSIGEEVATLVNETKQAGNYQVTFNSDKLTSGVYLYRLQSGDFVKTRKMILLK